MRKLFAVGFWLLASGCATVPLRQSVLSDENVREYAALLRMADSRTLDAAIVDRGLASSSSAVRVEAARAIGQVGRAQAAPRITTLRTLLRDTDGQVAAQAAYSLGLLRDTASVADLTEALTWSSPVAREAAWSLGQLGNAARDAIVSALVRGRADPATRSQLLLASAKLTPVPAQTVIDYFDDPSPSVVWAAAYAISRTRTAAGLSALQNLGDSLVAHRPVRPAVDSIVALRDRSSGPYADDENASFRVRAEIARMLARSVVGDSLASRAIPTLVHYARDAHPHVRINAVRALGGYGARAREHVITAVRDRDANVRVAAAQALGVVRDSARLDWGPLWAADTALTYRQAILESAMRLGTELPALAEWHTASDWRRRSTVATVAALAATPEQRLRLARSLLMDADARVRGAAVAGIAPDTNSLNAEIRSLLTAARSDADRQVRERAAARLTGRSESEEEPAAPVRDIAWYETVVREIVAPSLDGRPVRATLNTVRGPIVAEFYGADAPLTVKNFLDLARAGTYRGTRFHRVVPNFVAQDGDPRGDGSGGPGYSIRDELNRQRYERGTLGMALSGPDTGGSQWFITHSPQPHLDGGYTVFGRVISGFAALDALVQGDLLVDVK